MEHHTDMMSVVDHHTYMTSFLWLGIMAFIVILGVIIPFQAARLRSIPLHIALVVCILMFAAMYYVYENVIGILFVGGVVIISYVAGLYKNYIARIFSPLDD